MQVNISQELFIRKFTGKMPRPRLSPECGRRLCASLHSRNALQHFSRGPEPRRTLVCEPARSKCKSKFHKSHFIPYTENYRKNAAAQIEPRMRTQTLCELAQSKCTSTFPIVKFSPNSQQITGFCSQNVADSKEKCPRLENKKNTSPQKHQKKLHPLYVSHKFILWGTYLKNFKL